MIKSEIAQLVAMLLAAYPNARMTDETSAVYETILRDLDFKLAQRAVTSIIASSKFMPTISEIREMSMILKHGRKRAGGEAWGDVLRAMGRYGRARVPSVDFTFEDPVVALAVTALGWSDLCRSDNSTADRARFIELYDHLERSEREEILISTGLTPKKQPKRVSGTKKLKELTMAPLEPFEFIPKTPTH